MEWCRDGIVVSTRRHGENGVIIGILTREQGRWLGLVRYGRSRKMRPILQPGNLVTATWRARLEDHLGNFTIEPLQFKAAALIEYPFKLAGLTTLTALVQLLPEREAHPPVYEGFELVLNALGDDDMWPALAIRWELGLLDELGFGLDLSKCAATGEHENLIYVSPKSGRAVSAQAGEPYKDKLFKLPEFLAGRFTTNISDDDLLEGFRLTGYFLHRHLFEPRGLQAPEQRQWIVDHIANRT